MVVVFKTTEDPLYHFNHENLQIQAPFGEAQ